MEDAMMNLISKNLILILITAALSYGLVILVNNASSTSEFLQEGEKNGVPIDQTGTTAVENLARPIIHESRPDRDGDTGFAMVEIGKNIGIIAGITTLVVALQTGIKKFVLRKRPESV
jgi:hypothetical protein